MTRGQCLKRGRATCRSILDDIVIHSATWDKHLMHIEVLRQLEDTGLTIKLHKCTFEASECSYLVHNISRGVKLEQSKVEAVHQFKKLHSKREI